MKDRLQGLPVTMDEKEKLVRRLSGLWTLGLIALWYICNIGVLLLNKYLLSSYGFRYPIFLTMCHMSACSLFSYIAITWLRLVPMQVSPHSPMRCHILCTCNTVNSPILIAGDTVGRSTFQNNGTKCRVLHVSRQRKHIPQVSPSLIQSSDWSDYSFLHSFPGLHCHVQARIMAHVCLFDTSGRWGHHRKWGKDLLQLSSVFYFDVPICDAHPFHSLQQSEPSFHFFGFIICFAATAARALKSVLQGVLLQADV